MIDTGQPRLLFVTETASWPPWQGDSARVASLISFFRMRGWKIHVAHFHDETQDWADYEGMANRCDGLSIYRPTARDLAQRERSRRLDDWCPDAFVEHVATDCDAFAPDVLLVQFVFFSRCFFAPRGALKPLRVLEAGDIFSDRDQLYGNLGLPYRWFSTDRVQETVGLRRADVILAIQESEARELARRVPDREILLVPHCIEVDAVPPDERSINLLFVGPDNVENVYGLQTFVERAFPTISERFPQVRLQVCGRAGKRLANNRNVHVSGNVVDLTPYYHNAFLVINPTPIGTGLKIKTVEALCHGRCLVSTPAGVQGLEAHRDIFVVAESPQDFASRIVELLNNSERACAIGLRARRFAADYFSRDSVFGALASRLETSLNFRR